MSENETHEDEDRRLKLDALKAIRESAYSRWEKRRAYEWQLSISIWTALAAFSAIVLRRDFPIENKVGVAVFVGLFAAVIVGIQTHYLNKMIQGTLGDAEIQRWAEKRIYKLAFDGNIWDEKEKGYMPEHDFYRRLSNYGVVLQVGITLLLAIGAVCAVVAPWRPPAAGNPPAATQANR
jgi:hypothetical protein